MMIIPIVNRKGFTIIELLLGTVIIAILAAVIIPRISKAGLYEKLMVYTSTHKIAADMRLARRLAVTTGDKHRITFFSTGGSSDYNAYNLERNISGNWEIVGEGRIIPDEISETGNSRITFNSNGSATSSETFRYHIGTYRYRINVRQATGRTLLEAY